MAQGKSPIPVEMGGEPVVGEASPRVFGDIDEIASALICR